MKEATVICPFEHIEVSEERYSKAIKKFRDSSLQVDQYGFFVAGGKWKVGWKKITQLLIDEQSIYISTVKGNDEADDDDPEENSSKKGLQVQARIADVRAPSEWPSFRRYVIKKWEKLQGRKRRIEDAIKEQAEEEARQARRAAVKPKRSRMERFVMKNLANMKTFDDESDDETFNRRNHKTLMAERKRQEETRPESQEPKDEAVSHDEEEEREPALDDEDSDSTATQPGDKKTPIVQQKARRLKRKSLLEEDSDDEGLFGGNPGVTDISTGRPVVTPGASLKKAAILDDDDDDDDDDEEKSNADIANVAPITNYFKPKVAAIPSTSVIAKQASSHKASEKPTTTKMTEKLVLATPLLPSKNKNDQKVAPANFFAPRLAKVAHPTETPEGSEDDTVVATPPPKAPRTPPRSVYKHLYQSSASRMEQDDDQVMDYIDERHVSPRSHATTTPVGEQPNGTRLTKRKNYFGTKAPPGRGSAVFALDQADKSPAPRNIYEGLEFVSPSKQRTPASSPPRKRPTWESPLSLSSHKNDTPPAPSVSNSRFRGLRNLGNTCYINSSLQMLFSIPDFVQALNPFAHSRRLVESLCMTFQDVIHPFEGFAGPASAKKLKTALDSTTDKFRGYQQRDAHEFLGHLIDEVHEQIEQKRADDKEAEACGLDDLLPTDDFFRLNVEVNLKCKSCGYSRYVFLRSNVN
jgi:Ubiquitin carboxyl-terminal hydrolase